MRCSFLLPGLVLGLLAAPALGQRNLKDIPDPDPMQQLARLRAAEGFEINLFASDPDIAKPIQMNWDPSGRLWVATSSVYPQLEPGEVADDKIIVLEDTDGDGVSDQRTVFADGLLIPTSVLPTERGAYVANSTELLLLEDTDGDGRADEREVVFSGFGSEDTHHILHMLRRGPGGYVYFNQSIYIHSNIETPWGLRRLDAGGIWRFRPSTLELEVWVRGFVNPWGHRFDDWGQQFATDGAFGEGINYVFPGAAFVTAAHVDRILRGLSPGQPKHCGLGMLSGTHLPEDMRGTFLANDFRGNRINRFRLEDSGSGYAARQLSDFVWTDHVAFRPIDVNVGPDGAVYIADWYNPIIQHGEVDFRDPRRDRTHGRIWRVSATGRATVQAPDLTQASPDEAVAALASPERWTRDAARQVITERPEAMAPALRRAAAARGTAASEEQEQLRLELLWAHQSVGLVDTALLHDTLSSSDHRVRAAAVRVLADEAARVEDVRERLSAAVGDEHPRVRLEAINGLRRLGDADAARRALAALDHGLDENLDYALWLTVRELKDAWLRELAAAPGFLGSADRLVFALSASGAEGSLGPAVALWRSGALDATDRASLAGLFGRYGGSAELDLLAAEATLASDDTRSPALDALLAASRQRGAAPGSSDAVAAWLDRDARATRLVGRYRREDGPSRLATLALAEGASADLRREALEALADDGRPAAAAALADLAGAERPLEVRSGAVAAWARLDVGAAADAAAPLLSEPGSEAVASELTASFLAVAEGPAGLARALEGATLPEAAAAAALRAASTSPQDTEALEQALRDAAQLGPLALELSDEELARLVEAVRTQGDPRRGEAIYRREVLQCIRCHAIGGAGGITGPDLSSIGGSAQPDYLIESLLQPSKKIKEGYHTTTVLRTDGTIATGVLVSRTDDELVLRDSNAEEVVVYAEEVDEEVISTTSLMPTGLITELRRPEFVDLVAFLSRLGKEGDLRVGPERLVRSWQVLDVTSAISGTLRAKGVQAPAREPEAFPWRGVTSTVAGALPLAELPAAQFFAGQRFRIARFGLTTPEAGSALLRLSAVDGLSLFVEGEPVDAAAETTLELEAGTSRVTLILEEGRFPAEFLTVELRDVPGSTARAELAPGF